MKCINSYLPAAESTEDLMMKLFPNEVETTEHLPHWTTLGFDLQNARFHLLPFFRSNKQTLLQPRSGGFLSNPKRHWLCLQSQLCRAVVRKTLLRAQESGSETLRRLSSMQQKGLLKNWALIQSQKSVLVICVYLTFKYGSPSQLLLLFMFKGKPTAMEREPALNSSLLKKPKPNPKDTVQFPIIYPSTACLNLWDWRDSGEWQINGLLNVSLLAVLGSSFISRCTFMFNQ